MTEQEAISVLKMIETHGSLPTNAKDEAIKALEEVQKYREIGTVEECCEAVEKMEPKKVIDNTPTDDDFWYQCPTCKADLTRFRSFYCDRCGQKLEW